MSKIIKVRLQKAVSIATTFTTILWLSGAALLAPMAAKAVVLHEGDLIRGPDGIKVYIINANGYKRHVFNPAVFNMYGHLKWSNIKSVDQATLDSYKTSDLYRAAGEAPVYQTAEDGIKHWLNMTWDQFIASGYSADQVFTVNGAEKVYYTTGSELTYSGAVTPVAGGLTVSLAADSPASAVIPQSAARAAFLKVNLTAGSGADVDITKFVVERQGVAADNNFSDLVLLDGADNTQIGLAQSLNAAHQAVFTDKVTVTKGTTKSIIFGGNMASTLNGGETPKLALMSITTTATVSGSLPIVGNPMTMNATLVIGSATATRGSLDPGADATKNVGTTGYNFAAVKITAGATEDITVQQFRFNQSGSAASSDLANMKVKAGTVSYDTTVSSDGKYYTAVLGSGIPIAKGENKEFTIYGDIIGGSNRTVAMDVYKMTDIVIKGNLYGYNITVGGGSAVTSSDGVFSSSNYPFYNSYDVTINKGTLRVDKNTSVIAGNIAEGSTQTLGALDFVVQGESIRISDLYIELDQEASNTTAVTAADVTLVTMYDKDGNAVLGPVDATVNNNYGDQDASDGYIRYTSTLIVPAGTNTYTVKAKLSTDFSNNDTIRIGMNTPATRVVTATGQTTGETITATPATATWANTQTVKTGALSLSVSSLPVSQNVVKGLTGYTFAQIMFDATASGEDVSVTSLKLQHIISAAAEGNKVSNLALWDGNKVLNTGSNVVNPTDVTNTTQEDTYTFDSGVVISKSSVKTLALKGNISASATADTTHRFGIDASPDVSVSGVSTGSDITEVVTADSGPTMTIKGNGAFAVALDSGTHTGKLVYGGQTGVEMTRLRFNATTEAVSLETLILQYTHASSTVTDVAKIYLYDTSNNKLSEAVATSTTQVIFTIASGAFIIPKDGEKVMIVKADLGDINTNNNLAGDVIALDYNGSYYSSSHAYDETKGTGQSSGSTVYSDTKYDTAQTAVYLYKGIPKFEKLSRAAGSLSNATQEVYKFKVTAQGSDIDLLKFTFLIATTTMNTEDFTLVDVTEAGEQTLYASSTSAGVVGNVNVAGSSQYAEIYLGAHPGTTMALSIGNATPRTVSTAVPRTFAVRLTNSAVASGDSLSIQMEGDAAHNGNNGVMQTAANVDAWGDDDCVWGDRSGTTTHAVTVNEWTNGYLVDGLPSSNMASEVLSL